MKNLLNFIFGALCLAAFILVGYYTDLLLSAIHTPELVAACPCYQNPIGKLAVKTLFYFAAETEAENKEKTGV